jgi:hypothetical protein
MKRLLALLMVAGMLTAMPVHAEESALKSLEEAGIVVAMDPPEASAEALLKLPDVYALPGTFSYWVMHLIEEVQLLFTADPEDRASLLLSFSRNRLAEGYEAVKSGKADAALHSLQDYQQGQVDLATSLNNLQNEDVSLKPYLDRLNEQLGLQQALQEYVESEVLDQVKQDEISGLLEISEVQRLVWQRQTESVLLGERDVRQPSEASSSASPSAIPAE